MSLTVFPSPLAISRGSRPPALSYTRHLEATPFWNVDRGDFYFSLPKLRYWVATMLSIAERFLILGTYDGPILHLDISTHEERRNFQLEGHAKGVVSLAILNSGLLVSGSLDASIRFWDLGRRECVDTLRGHEKEVSGVVPLTDRYLASASVDQTIRIWDLETSRQIHRVDCDAGLHCIAATPDRQSLFAGDERGQVHFLRIENLGF
jgi:WD40 repeat protein